MTQKPAKKIEKGQRKRNKVELAEFEAKVVKLKRNGVSYQEIAQTTGDNVSTVWRAFQRAIKRIPAAEVAEMRETQKAQLEEILQRAMAIAQKDKNVFALAEARKALDQQARLFGLNAPLISRTELTGADGGAIKTEQGITREDVEEMSDEERATLRTVMERKLLNGKSPKSVN